MSDSAIVRTYPGGYVRPEWQVLAHSVADAPAATSGDLALVVGVSAQTIRNWRRNPEYQAYEMWLLGEAFGKTVVGAVSGIAYASRASTIPLTSLTTRERLPRIKEEISEYAVECFDRLKDIMETTTSEKLQADVARDLLDRAGHQAVRREAAPRATFVLTPQLYEILQKRQAEAGFTVEAEILGEGLGAPEPKA